MPAYPASPRSAPDPVLFTEQQKNHHRRKLRERVAAIQDILTDLEYREPGKPDQPRDGESSAASGDYSVAFCSGEENCRLYTVIDGKFLTELGK